MVIVDSERLSSTLSFRVCATTAGRDCCQNGGAGGGGLSISCGCGYCCHRGCSCRGLFLPHYHHGGDDTNRHCCHCKGGRGKGHFPMPFQERGKGGGSIPSPTAIVGGMTPTAVADAARGVVR